MIAFLRKLWVFVRRYKARLFLGLICGVLFALANGAVIIVIKLVVDLVFTGSAELSFEQHLGKAPAFLRPLLDRAVSHLPELKSPSSRLGQVLLIGTIPVIMFVRGLFAYLNIYMMNWAAARAIADIRTRLFEHLQNLSLGFFSRASTGDLISRITNDTQVLYSIIGGSLSSMVKDPVTILTLLVLMLVQQPRLTLISMVVLPICIVPIVVYGRKVRKSARAMQGHISELTGLMHESFTGNRIVKAYNLEDRVIRQFKETTGKYVSHVMRVVRANEMPSQLTEFLAAVGVALVLTYVVYHGSQSEAGDFFAFVLSIVMMYAPLKALTRLHNQLHQAASASQRVFELLETKNTVLDPPHPLPLQADHADIRFQEVSFDYGEKPVLRGVNLTVRAGELVALVGGSGSGKTTLVNLLPRFHDPQRGVVRIGPADIRQVSIKELRRQIALVTQETILFHDTIRRNIAVGRPGATDAEIESAARHADAHEFILQKPQGYETVVGEKGALLSGGQKQRLAIARALLKDAPILILDEATSALDTESERAVQAALEKLMQGRTTICIAHRLSTILHADVIVVLDQGRIVEQGKHDELIRRGGMYRKLYELQFPE